MRENNTTDNTKKEFADLPDDLKFNGPSCSSGPLGHRLVDINQLKEIVEENFCCKKCCEKAGDKYFKKHLNELLTYADKEFNRAKEESEKKQTLLSKLRVYQRELKQPSQLYKSFFIKKKQKMLLCKR